MVVFLCKITVCLASSNIWIFPIAILKVIRINTSWYQFESLPIKNTLSKCSLQNIIINYLSWKVKFFTLTIELVIYFLLFLIKANHNHPGKFLLVQSNIPSSVYGLASTSILNCTLDWVLSFFSRGVSIARIKLFTLTLTSSQNLKYFSMKPMVVHRI